MTRIVKQNSYQSCFLLRIGDSNPLAPEGGYSHIHQMKCTQSVLKPAVSGSRIYKAGEAKLFYVPQPLKPWVLNKVKNEITRDAYKTINRIVDYFSLISQIDHLEFFMVQK
jgi:hypothetical protein